MHQQRTLIYYDQHKFLPAILFFALVLFHTPL